MSEQADIAAATLQCDFGLQPSRAVLESIGVLREPTLRRLLAFSARADDRDDTYFAPPENGGNNGRG